MNTGLLFRAALAILSAAASLPAGAALAAGLPNGATQLREVYHDWTVLCRVTTTDGSDKVGCSLEQVQLKKGTRQRVIATTLVLSADGSAKGSFLLPFGLAVTDGVTLQIDTGRATKPVPFKTCLAVGCIVQFDWPAETIDGMRNAEALKVTAKNAAGAVVPFSVSLNGLAAAADRVRGLVATE